MCLIDIQIWHPGMQTSHQTNKQSFVLFTAIRPISQNCFGQRNPISFKQENVWSSSSAWRTGHSALLQRTTWASSSVTEKTQASSSATENLVDDQADKYTSSSIRKQSDSTVEDGNPVDSKLLDRWFKFRPIQSGLSSVISLAAEKARPTLAIKQTKKIYYLPLSKQSVFSLSVLSLDVINRSDLLASSTRFLMF